ncbi:MAG: DUF99 family protein [Candidatus Micrarchaeia archaeon]
MKLGIRILSLGCAPLIKKDTLLVGIISKNDEIEGIVSTYIEVDGTDSTNKIIKLVKNTRFKDQIKIIAINGLGIAGLNILDVFSLEKELKIKVVSLTRKKPHPQKLINALEAFSKETKKDIKNRIELVKKLKKLNIIRINNLYAQTTLDEKEIKKFVKEIFKMLRLAHMIASGVTKRESKNRL